LEYASQNPGLMHACGHDVHVAALIGAARHLAQDQEWTGTLIVVFQPAEETGKGALALIADGLFERFGRPDVVLGQHVGPAPAGVIGIRSGVAFAGSDLLKITLYGRGGHGSRPETTVDPVLMAAELVGRLQGIVSREVAPSDSVVVTVGSVHAGTAANIIPDTAELQLSIRTFDADVRDAVLASIARITRAEARASGADREPDIDLIASLPILRNDSAACDRVATALQERLPTVQIIDPGVVAGSEDVGELSDAAGAPIAYWILGGADPALFAGATDPEGIMKVVGELPSNHSPFFAPIIDPTLAIGARALHAAARSWLR
jgi:amidohydrolase